MESLKRHDHPVIRRVVRSTLQSQVVSGPSRVLNHPSSFSPQTRKPSARGATLGTPGGDVSLGNAMNNRGEVLGISANAIPDP